MDSQILRFSNYPSPEIYIKGIDISFFPFKERIYIKKAWYLKPEDDNKRYRGTSSMSEMKSSSSKVQQQFAPESNNT